MARRRLKGKSNGPERSSPIKSGSTSGILDGLVRFSLKFYDANNHKFSCRDRDRSISWHCSDG